MLANDSFTLQGVRTMVSISRLYSASKIIDRIYGTPLGENLGEKSDADQYRKHTI